MEPASSRQQRMGSVQAARQGSSEQARGVVIILELCGCLLFDRQLEQLADAVTAIVRFILAVASVSVPSAPVRATVRVPVFRSSGVLISHAFCSRTRIDPEQNDLAVVPYSRRNHCASSVPARKSANAPELRRAVRRADGDGIAGTMR